MTNTPIAAESSSESSSMNDELINESIEQLDFSKNSKSDLLHLLQDLKIEDNIAKTNAILKQIKNSYDLLLESEKQTALQKYLNEEGVLADFEFKKDELSIKFDKIFEGLKDKVAATIAQAEKDKEKNLIAKKHILEQLRILIAGEETNQSIISLKDYQDQWKKIGQVPSAAHQELWQSYTALVDRFYNNRSIYFELKELDRKKNLESKIEICEKAEKLIDIESINQSIRDLKTLHDEYKLIGPVPKEDQEALWQRFKNASDKIYDKRQAYLADLKAKQDEALLKKQDILNKLQEYVDFKSDRIDDWKEKTTQLLAIQEEWKKIGNVPYEQSKEITKKFWASGKQYFANKESFFAQLEEKKQHNLALKVALCEQAELLLEAEDTPENTQKVKDLSKQWDKIGAVPIKQKEHIFNRFKKASDAYFQRKRDAFSQLEKEYELNYDKKLEVCNQIIALAQQTAIDEQSLKALQQEFSKIGFVPKDKIKAIQEKYQEAINLFIKNIDGKNGGQTHLKLSLEINAIKNAPDSEKKIQKREGDLLRKINTLKAEINQYATNMEFFGRSANADKLKKEIQQKIDTAHLEVKELESQLKTIKQALLEG
ncbi:MAG: DUF349 domain-containing protein [Cytophagales bacterium]|nr:MAG: DUF349 domain-containing protein [Cytophagales bacterium]